MSMHAYPIMMFGIDLEHFHIKKEWCNDTDDDIKPKYDNRCDFLNEEFCYKYGIIEYESNEYADYLGIPACQAWQHTDEEKAFKDKDDAAKYIAHKLAPYFEESEEEIAKACDYIEDTYCG